MIPVIDLFAGPGGLGEGFSSVRQADGSRAFKTALSIEKDAFAHQTLRLRSFYRLFDPPCVPDRYYSVVRGESSWEQLEKSYPSQTAQADEEAWRAELGRVSRGELNQRVLEGLKRARGRSRSEHWVLIGGPPCQAYSLVGRSRRKGIADYRPEKDERNTLYLHYLQLIADHWPSVFVMENVKGILSHTYLENPIFDQILRDLKDPYRALDVPHKSAHRYRIISLVRPSSGDSTVPSDFVVRSENFGVPQKRHRVILLGIRDDLGTCLPEPLTPAFEVGAGRVLSGLPALRSGLSKEPDSGENWENALRDCVNRRWFRGVRKAAGEDVEEYISEIAAHVKAPSHERGKAYISDQIGCDYRPDWYLDPRLEGVCDHVTRSHIREDLFRYLFCSSYAKRHSTSPSLEYFPAGLLPDHANVDRDNFDSTPFKDRFKVQVETEPATTVTSHISKDGHYYIHPDPYQCRSLTVREAARLQTFPDNYHFMGPRTSQYAQVGNAVPPLLARQVAIRVAELLSCRL